MGDAHLPDPTPQYLLPTEGEAEESPKPVPLLDPGLPFPQEDGHQAPLQLQEPETPKLGACNEHIGPSWVGTWDLRQKEETDAGRGTSRGEPFPWRHRGSSREPFIKMVAKRCLAAVKHSLLFLFLPDLFSYYQRLSVVSGAPGHLLSSERNSRSFGRGPPTSPSLSHLTTSSDGTFATTRQNKQ